MLAAAQTEFARALLDSECAVPQALTAHTARHPEKRFAVYRNNVVAGLVNALRSKFPATSRIVGDEFFAAMARVFVTAHPPRSKILHTYGDDFGDFIAAFDPAAEMPYLADVARLEAARTRAYHAADAASLGPENFSQLDPDRLGALRFTLHPSLQIVRSRYPAVTIWAMNAGEMDLGAVDFDIREDALVLRPDLAVTVRTVPPGAAEFFAALSSGTTLSGAATSSLSDEPRFDLTAGLACLIGSGAVTAFSVTDTPHPEGTAS
ncbi:MAG: DUF2063 domain-containing protein [Pseudorhodoplanes sp.]|uniref:HvfC/BufC N-terminal domain-containing protein n=1 Tax=Pseudorhodoplanes sp. TaxID=1934341 RepID=UPI003D0D3902